MKKNTNENDMFMLLTNTDVFWLLTVALHDKTRCV